MNLNQVTIPSTDLARSSEFYRQLGLTQIVDAIPRYARFECPGGSTLSLHRVERVDPESGFVIYFEDVNLDEWIDDLRQQGVEFESGPRDERWGWREARLRDPDGNVVCLFFGGQNRRYPPWRIDAEGKPSTV